MTQETIGLVRHEDIIQPFMLNNSIMRGRVVRLDHTVGAILSRHEYHSAVSHQLGELLVIGAMLSAGLPPKGILTLQVKGNGLISFMVVDVQQDGSIRGYANVEEEAAAHLASLEAPDFHTLLGDGYLAMTLAGEVGDPYQGIVPLEGDSLAQAVERYFSQSQQLDVLLRIHTGRRVREDGTARWVASGLMLERMPELAHEAAPGDGDEIPEAQDWDYHRLLVGTLTDEELSDPHLAPSALLYRLFNEGGVWVYDTMPVVDRCRCSREKIAAVLARIPAEEVRSLADEAGQIATNCQFCNREERFEVGELV